MCDIGWEGKFRRDVIYQAPTMSSWSEPNQALKLIQI